MMTGNAEIGVKNNSCFMVGLGYIYKSSFVFKASWTHAGEGYASLNVASDWARSSSPPCQLTTDGRRDH
jgi:hypothetical protein